jgi:hypothetical protein
VPFGFSLPDRSIISTGVLHEKSEHRGLSVLVVSAIMTLAVGEWWHWVAVIAAIVVFHVLRRK